MKNDCPSCGAASLSTFYEVKGIPIHSVVLMPTPEVARYYPKGDLVLGFCSRCGFITNRAFDPGMQEYASQYEETQGFSSTFNAFHRRLAMHLIDRYELHNKDVIEIGCGKGEFLSMLCEIGNNRGVGFDPSYVDERNHSAAKDRLNFIKDFYSEKYADYQGDFVCCKMTLEHIQNPFDFVRTIRRSIDHRTDTIVFFQVPNVVRILRELAFWDIYYEHCSYFSLGSLARLLRSCGFDILDLRQDYDDQYLMIEARAGGGQFQPSLAREGDLDKLASAVAYFAKNHQSKLGNWKSYLQAMKRMGYRVVLWGGGSKAVAFLTTLGIQDEIEYVVDINPHKQGTFIAGSGQEIVAPHFLQAYKPDKVIVMNPVYRTEIQHELARMGLGPEMRSA